MTGSLEGWVNKMTARRRAKEELKDILAEYFAGGIDEDEELAAAMGLDPEEVRRMRQEYEA